MEKSKITRRNFLALTGAAGLSALSCRRSMKAGEKLIPYINPPEYPKPGDWAFYSTTCRECPAGCGLMMWHRDGRITKAEGNPLHPVNKGKLCIRGQAAVQGEYNPGRIRDVLEKNAGRGWIEPGWDQAIPAVKKILQFKKPVIISRLETGSLAGVIEDFASGYSAKPVWYEPFNYESMRIAGKEVYGTELIPRFDISGSDLIISFNADFLETWLSPVEYTGHFADMHSPDGKTPGKLIYIGYSENLTALNADEFIISQPGSHTAILNKITLNLVRRGAIRNKHMPVSALKYTVPADLSGVDEKVIEKLTSAIINARAPVIIAGKGNDRSVDGVATVKAVYLLNELLGNHERVNFSQYHALSKTAYRRDVQSLVKSFTSENVVVIHNTNPVYAEPGFEEYLKKASAVIYIGSESNETSAIADYVLPSHYPLEDWGDYEPWKGTVSLLQPVMRPLYNSKSAGDIFIALGRNEKQVVPFSSIARSNLEKWSGRDEKTSPEQKIRASNIKIPSEAINPAFSFFIAGNNDLPVIQDNMLYIDPVPSLFFYDGRLADRSWLQEIPEPLSDIVWQNCINIHYETAEKLSLKDGQSIIARTSEGSLEGPVRFTKSISKNVISVSTGQGHWSFGETANGRGINVFSVIPEDFKDPLPLAKIEKSGEINLPVYLNSTREQYGRDLLRVAQYGSDIKKENITMPLPGGYLKDRDLYAPHSHTGHRWAMVIDLQRCIGCKACVAACYAENNIPVMGKEDCERGLEMAWLKVPAYKTGDKTSFLPLPCQHCDAAPCEPVCPVYASSHTEEGLNAQIYNRCVGTRYCSNNCPYKVRRFNWKNIRHEYPETLQLNPEVTVRGRGVMEKCTFCVQRIRNAEYSALKNNRTLQDGDIIPACAQTCPAEAIVFGDLLDPGSHVSLLFEHERRYQLLQNLNTKPAVIYLKKIILET